jgi:hypothetical protein
LILLVQSNAKQADGGISPHGVHPDTVDEDFFSLCLILSASPTMASFVLESFLSMAQ